MCYYIHGILTKHIWVLHYATHDTRLTHSHRKLRLAEDFVMLRLMPDFKRLRLTFDFKTLRHTPATHPPDADGFVITTEPRGFVLIKEVNFLGLIGHK